MPQSFEGRGPARVTSDEAVLDFVDTALVKVDRAARIQWPNRRAARLFDQDRDRLRGQPLGRFLPGVDGRVLSENERLAALLVRAGGGTRSVRVRIADHVGAGDGSFWVEVRDVTDQYRNVLYRKFVRESAPMLAGSKRLEDVLSAVAKAAVRSIANWCLIEAVNPDGELACIEAAAADPADGASVEALALNGFRPAWAWSADDGWRSARPRLVRRVRKAHFARLARTERQYELLSAVRIASYMAIPMRGASGTVGSVFLATEPDHLPYGPRDAKLAEDVASRVALALEHARAHEAERAALRARDRVLGVVAHDLRNPLNGIALAASAIADPAFNAGATRRDPKFFADAILKQTDRMNRLIQDLLDIARVQAGTFRLVLAEEHVGNVLEESARALRSSADQAGVALAVRRSGRMPKVRIDRHRLQQLLGNLIENAIRATHAGGRITLEARRVRDDAVRVAVIDTGSGIEPERLARLFEPIWNRSEQGTARAGLGLSIASEIARAHGSTLEVESELGRGTRFWLDLAVAPVEDGTTPGGDEEVVAPSPVRT